ncbi:hypothetical protein G4B88_030729 [Cannabis sativa]|uniref:Uncharacterized protein n=1 Tax=Cannabis sativa TaxID=3483 RepID=A0A7J6HAE8_CANSA|nr:hypothetical protein G4B88_030729 [Cannabis sativa]
MDETPHHCLSSLNFNRNICVLKSSLALSVESERVHELGWSHAPPLQLQSTSICPPKRDREEKGRESELVLIIIKGGWKLHGPQPILESLSSPTHSFYFQSSGSYHATSHLLPVSGLISTTLMDSALPICLSISIM